MKLEDFAQCTDELLQMTDRDRKERKYVGYLNTELQKLSDAFKQMVQDAGAIKQ